MRRAGRTSAKQVARHDGQQPVLAKFSSWALISDFALQIGGQLRPTLRSRSAWTKLGMSLFQVRMTTEIANPSRSATMPT